MDLLLTMLCTSVDGKGNQTKSSRNTSITVWLGFAIVALIIHHCVAEQEITSLLTLSVYAQALAFLFLQIHVTSSKSVAGISAKALILHAVKLVCRLSSTVWLDGYLPTDDSGDWIYQMGDLVSFLLVMQTLLCILVTHKKTYNAEFDDMDVRHLVLGAVFLAVLIHPDMNAWITFDILWTVHLYIDAVAMVPQLWMVSKMGGKIHNVTAHYVAATFLSNVLSALFWFLASAELGEDEHGVANSHVNVAGIVVNGAHVVQLLLLADFAFFYGKTMLSGRSCGSSSMEMSWDI